MSRTSSLTAEQKRTIEHNIDAFPSEIGKLPGMEGVTRHTIRGYQQKVKAAETPIQRENLAAALQRYINRHGLPSRFHGRDNVTGFLEWLKRQ